MAKINGLVGKLFTPLVVASGVFFGSLDDATAQTAVDGYRNGRTTSVMNHDSGYLSHAKRDQGALAGSSDDNSNRAVSYITGEGIVENPSDYGKIRVKITDNPASNKNPKKTAIYFNDDRVFVKPCIVFDDRGQDYIFHINSSKTEDSPVVRFVEGTDYNGIRIKNESLLITARDGGSITLIEQDGRLVAFVEGKDSAIVNGVKLVKNGAIYSVKPELIEKWDLTEQSVPMRIISIDEKGKRRFKEDIFFNDSSGYVLVPQN